VLAWVSFQVPQAADYTGERVIRSWC